ncbi:sugar ABC transporter substrate-binding protein [Lachnoanaerobaculum saburreum]|jgi:family|uniref:Sugar-binding domain protein n=1 Tax=Lachnoanaerobaculum saburreum TaxID=467210 RepID=A0A133ZC24_9FIRM|nr:sugar ABC transporter substrate-binding protein [Lachnoanaerobaculum saburreum]KXB52984.1 sugar-binding domain protein [Lachnoanaerobaculum saburreum]MBF1010746.1 sugar ABC transporter substrate-binding protein [Lachnoanaerobaculum sp.]
MRKILARPKEMILLTFILVCILGLFLSEKLYGETYEKVESYSCLIGLSLPEVENPSHGALMEELHSEMKNRDINVIMKEAGGDFLQQCKDIKQLASYGVDVMVISPIDSESVREAIKELNMPVIILENPKFFDAGSVYMEYDSVWGGRALSHMILNEHSEGILLLRGSEYDPVSRQREAAFVDSLTKEQKESLTILEVGKNRDEAERAMKYFLISNHDIKAVAGLSAQTLYGAYLAAVKLRNFDMDFYGMDNEMSIKKISDGDFHWIVYSSMAKKILDVGEELYLGKEVEKRIEIGEL